MTVEAAAEWALAYVAHRETLSTALEQSPKFNEWAKSQEGFRTMKACLDEVLRDAEMPAFPLSALPWWAVSSETHWSSSGGETAVMFYGREHRSGEVSAMLEGGLYVTVGENENGDPIGTMHWWEDAVFARFPDDLEIRTPEQAAAYAEVMRSVGDELREIRQREQE
ncbi:hypothetical protein [Microbacterium sp. SA39]|uniref:hypothetical protein n=1 Tax=Microbacterium sp. SA39 TaxID=1263625 RepID=UPI0005FA582A|nr:hypothetical protein [Microbacterium sp. SA39]KJQ54667.1 hypothetical protein RS85_01396 [Microbacterium sp. SA39]